jgi:O-antigen/teichoic acid export membrane protein
LALQLSKIPTEKIVALINQVAFSAFSKLQGDTQEFNRFYLSITKVSMLIAFPIFLGGYLTGDAIVTLLLTEKWLPIIDIFRYLCIAQIFIALNANNSFVHFSQGRPQWGLYYQLACAVFMPVSFYLVIPYGLNAIVIPWLTINPILCLAWIYITIRKIGISVSVYFSNIMGALLASAAMVVAVTVLRNFLERSSFNSSPAVQLALCIIIGGGGLIYWLFGSLNGR